MPFFLGKKESASRLREAHDARRNREEIVRELSQGRVTRRDLLTWGLFTASGALAWKNGLDANGTPQGVTLRDPHDTLPAAF